MCMGGSLFFSSGVQAEDCVNRVIFLFFVCFLVYKDHNKTSQGSVDGGNSSSPCMSSCKWKIGAGCKPLYKILEKHTGIRAARPARDYRFWASEKSLSSLCNTSYNQRRAEIDKHNFSCTYNGDKKPDVKDSRVKNCSAACWDMKWVTAFCSHQCSVAAGYCCDHIPSCTISSSPSVYPESRPETPKRWLCVEEKM